jgi:hypothetical protein
MSGFFFFAHDCAKSALCCFPRVISWFRPIVSFIYAYTPTPGNPEPIGSPEEVVLGSGQPRTQVPTMPGYMNPPDDEQSEWILLATCSSRSYGIKSDGSLWGWGSPPLGDGTLQYSAVPRLIDEGPWQHVSTSETHTLAIKSDGTLWAWGDNTYGQLGNGLSGSYASSSGDNFVKCRARLSSSVASVNMYTGGLYKKRPTVSFVPQILPSATMGDLGYYVGNPGPRNDRGLWVNNQDYNPEGASGATGEPVMEFTLRSCSVLNAGSGYTSVPKATVVSDEAVDSPASVGIVGSFSIGSVEVFNGGSGYISQPTMTPRGFSGGSGFAAEAVIEGGVIVSVHVTSIGGGYRTSNTGETHAITVSGGGGTGAILNARLRDGFIHAAEVRDAGSGYNHPPTIEISGGGTGSGAEVRGDWRGPVVAVKVTNGGSGYTEIRDFDSGTTSFSWYRPRYVNVAFDRDPEDDLTTPAVAIASITPDVVQDITVVSPNASNNMTNAFFDSRDGRVGAFTLDNSFDYKTFSYDPSNPPDVMQQVEARIVGGGLSWSEGISLSASYSTTTETSSFGTQAFRSASLSYDGVSTHQFSDRPYVLVKASSPIYKPDRDQFGLVSTINVKSGTDWTSYTTNLRSDVEYDVVPWSGKVSGRVGFGQYSVCGLDGCTAIMVEHNDKDIMSEWNSLGGRVLDGAFSSTVGLTGSPTAAAGVGDAKISLLSNFDGTCVWKVDSPGTKYNQVREETESVSQGGLSFCSGGSEQSATLTYTRTSLVEVTGTRNPKLFVDYDDITPEVKFSSFDIPNSAWKGAQRSEGHIYALTSDTNGIGGECWKITRTNAERIIAGGKYSYEPKVTTLAFSSPVPQQIAGTWAHAHAAGNGAYYFSSNGYLDSLPGRPLSYAINESGQIYSWGMTANPEFCREPFTIGRPVALSCEWNKDAIPDGYDYYFQYGGVANRLSHAVAGSRFFVLDPPQSSFGDKPSLIASSRHCDEYKIFASSVAKSYFGTGYFSSDEKGLDGPSGVIDQTFFPFLNQFSGSPSTTHSAGMGYTDPPEVFFHAKGSPLLSVTASLVDVPAFVECNHAFARSASGQLWSLRGGWTITGSSPKLVARKATFNASQLFDSWVAVLGSAKGKRDNSFSPAEAGDYFNNISLQSTRSPGDIGFNSAFCESTASVQHTTTEEIDTVSAYAIIFDDGGEGFDDYSTWRLRVTPPPVVSLSGRTSSTTFDSGTLPQTENVQNIPLTKLAEANNQRAAIIAACSNKTFTPGDPTVYTLPQTLYIRNSVTHESKYEIIRTSQQDLVRSCVNVRGSLYVNQYDSAGADNPLGMGAAEIASVILVYGPFEDGVEPTVEFECVSGSNSNTSLPSFRIVPVNGTAQRSYGLTKIDGNWSDFDTESSSRKLFKSAFPGARGVKAPVGERDFVVIKNGVGLKDDGSLWELGDAVGGQYGITSYFAGYNAPRVMGNLEAKVTESGSGYTRPVNITLSKQPEGVATGSATVDGKLVAIGVENGGSYYRTPPTLTISGGATADAVIAGPVDVVEVQSGGSGYKCPPRLRFSRPGFSAFGTAVMSGHVESVVVADPGSGYQEPPEVTFDADGGSGATATATIKGAVASVTVDDSGSGYKSPPTVVFSGGGSGSGAEAFATMRRDGTRYRVASVEVTNGGSGYSSPPTVSFTGGGGGSGASATATLNAQIDTITITSPGEGYQDHPDVKISGSASAFAIASMSVGSVNVTEGGTYRSPPTVSFTAKKSVASISLSSGGSKYKSAPTVLIAGGVGSGSQAVCTISATVSKINVVSGGSGYSQSRPPRVVLTGGYDLAQGSQASAKATVDSTGKISAISVTSAGSVYRSAPKVSFQAPVKAVLEPVVEDGTVRSITVISGGYGYGAAPTILISGGSGATATASVDQDGKVTSVTVTDGGSGYSSSATAVAIYSFSGQGAEAVAELSGEVDKLTLTKVGSGYDDDAMPSVMFIGGGGDGAAATVTIEAAGSGGSATTKINGSIIYAKIKSQGSGYQDNPTITVSGGNNEKIAELNQKLADQEITVDQFNDQITEYRAVLQCGIAGTLSSLTVTSAGKHYVSGGRPSEGGPTCDRHGKRKSGGVVLSGYNYGLSRTASADIQTSTSTGGGGTVTSISSTTAKFCGNPSVHFSDTIGVMAETRMRVSSVAVAKGSPWDQNQYQFGALSEGAFIAGSGGSQSFGAAFGSPQMSRGALSDTCVVTAYKKDITPVFFRGRYYSADRKIKYKRAPSFVVESELGEGAVSQISLDSDGYIIDATLNAKTTYEAAFVRVIGQTSPYSTGLVGRTDDPGMRKYNPPTVTVTVQDGKVMTATLESLGGMDMFDLFSGYYETLGELVVHGGGGTGAKLSFDYSTFSHTGEIRVVNGGSGYTSTPQVTFVPHLSNGQHGWTVFGNEYGKYESEWQTWGFSTLTPLGPSGGAYEQATYRVEYVEGAMEDGYATLYGNIPVTQGGVYPMFRDGFVSDVCLTDGGGVTGSFSGPAFLQHYTTPPTATLAPTLTQTDDDVPAEVEVSVVNWSTVFTAGSAMSPPVMAVRDT